MLFFLVLATIVPSGLGNNTKKDYGPFTLPHWVNPQIKHKGMQIEVKVKKFDANLQATMMSSRAWRMTMEYHFLAWYSSSENSIVVRPDEQEAKEWIQKNQCLVGNTFETSFDNDCWKDLTEVKRENWISPRLLKTNVPDGVAFRSSCSLYWSCDIHSLSFPVYVSPNFVYEGLYIMGPKGEKLKADRNEEITVYNIEDSVIAFKPIQYNLQFSKVESFCVFSEDAKSYSCLVHYDGRDYSIIFDKYYRVAVNNILFELGDEEKKEIMNWHKTRTVGGKKLITDDNTGSPATIGDLNEIKFALMLENEELMYQNNLLNKEITEIKNTLMTVINSVAKIDDHLIGKIAHIPSKTKWLDSRTFVFTPSDDMVIDYAQNNYENCRGSYIYQNGRWKINYPNRRANCSKWSDSDLLRILTTSLNQPVEIVDMPEFRNATTVYDGWTYLDDGRTSLDNLDPRVKYQGNDFLNGLKNIFDISHYMNFIVIGILIIVFTFLFCQVIRK